MNICCPNANDEEPPRSRALRSFIELIKQNNGQLEDKQPRACTATGSAELAGWNVEVDLDAPFTPFVLSMMTPMLPNVPPPLPTLRLEWHRIQKLSGVTVVTLVPGHTEWCARWVPILSPINHNVLLVALDQSRTAYLQAHGTLAVIAGVPMVAGGLRHAASMFYRQCRRSFPEPVPMPNRVTGVCELRPL